MYGSELAPIDIGQEYLEHHGIKGQKWGVRRYQNTDGTYTDEGKRRRGRDLRRQAAKVAKGKNSEERKQFIKDSRDFMDKYGSDEYRSIANSGLESRVYNFLMSSGIVLPRTLIPKTPIRNTMKNISYDYDYDKTPYNPKGKTLKERYPRAGEGWGTTGYNAKLWDHIHTKSIDWYRDVPVSKEAKQWIKERDKMLESEYYSKEQETKHNKKLLGIVLNDLDLPDTKENRRTIEPYVFVD